MVIKKAPLNNQRGFLFENEKLIIISRASDKLKDVIEEIIDRKIEDITIILNASILEKKSKIRTFFEKNKEKG